jgi:hypothetical protein
MGKVILRTNTGATVRSFEVSEAARRRLEREAAEARRRLHLPDGTRQRNGQRTT